MLAGDQGAKFRVNVSNAGGSLTSDAAILNVTVPALELKLLAGSIAGPGYEDGPSRDAKFRSPLAITRDAAGNLYVADSGAVRKITPAGMVSTLAGKANESGNVDGVGSQARFGLIVSMTVDGQGNVYVAERNLGTTGNFIRKVSPAGVVSFVAGTVLKNGGATWQADGVGAAASFQFIGQMAVDRSGNLYVTDAKGLRKVQPDGTVTTLASFTCGFCLYGAGELDYPGAVVVDRADNIWALDRGMLRKITPEGLIFDVAGNGAYWWINAPAEMVDGQGTSASFGNSGLVSLNLDSNGNLLLAQDTSYWNGVVRRITPSGMVTTIAGQGTSPAGHDGPAAEATFGSLLNLAADSNGGVYIADSKNSAIRYLSSAGVVSTAAGAMETRDQGSTDGKGAAARFKLPGAVAVDAVGNAVVSDCGNATLRKITRDGVVTTVAGAAGQPGQVDGKGAASRVECPTAMVFGSDLTLYFNGGPVGADVALRRLAADGTVDTWRVRQSALTQPVVEGLAVTTGTDVFAAVNQPDTVGNSFVLRLAANGTSSVFASYPVQPALKGKGFSGLAGNSQGSFFATEYTSIDPPYEGMENFDMSRISATGIRTPAGPSVDARYGRAVLDALGNAYVIARWPSFPTDSAELQKITPDGTVTTVLGNAYEPTTRLGTAPTLRNARGLAIWGPNQLLVTTENAVLIATVPGVACDCKGR
ncbi:MAG TPA: hypothetical protein VGE36_11870 [Roseateles sp.]